MELFIDFASFFGAWLLVAGPLYQASLELREQDIAFDRIHAVRQKIPVPPKVSPWWWVLPPVKVYLEHRISQQYRDQFIRALEADDVEAIMNFKSKATGWVIVASGAALIAAKETYELWLHFHVPVVSFWLTLVGMACLSIAYTVVHVVREETLKRTHGRKKEGARSR